MIVHVPMLTCPNPKRVLIIGGGDGGSAREVLKHEELERVVMVDIDEQVVNTCREHLPGLNNGAFDNARLELIIGDGIDYMAKAADGSFDVIIIDSTDPIPDSCGEVLFTEDFYAQCKRVLSKDGVISTQSVMPMRYEKEIYRRAISSLQNSFGKDNTWVYLIPTDTYNGQTSLGLCFKGDAHPKSLDKTKVKEFTAKNPTLKYYNYKIHQASQCLPQYLKSYMGITEDVLDIKT
jgi:spermidine synthase